MLPVEACMPFSLAKSLLSLLLSECLVLNAAAMPAPFPSTRDGAFADNDQPAVSSQSLREATRMGLPRARVAASATLPVTVATGPEQHGPRLARASDSLRLVTRMMRPKDISGSRRSKPGLMAGHPTTTPTVVRAAFVENEGQWDSRVKFQLQNGGKTLWLTDAGIVFDSVRATVRKADPEKQAIPPRAARRDSERSVFCEDFVGAAAAPDVDPIDIQLGEYNYLVGSDPKGWHTGAHAYSGVIYRNVWDGIDVKISQNGPDIEQEFLVHPGANLGRVQIAYRGIERLEVARDGSLLVHTAFGDLKETTPRVYQEIGHKRVSVDGRFRLTGTSSYTVDIKSLNPQYALVIDPTLLYSTYLGGSNQDSGLGIAVDAAGNAYVTGRTYSSDFPTTPGSLSPGPGYSFVSKLSALGSSLVYSTYFGAYAYAYGIGVDSNGEAYVTGAGAAGDFPTTANAFQTSCNDSYFLSKLNAQGNGLIYSTCLGSGMFSGDGFGPYGVAIDPAGIAYLTGTVRGSLPTTPGAFQSQNNSPSYTAFVSVLNPAVSGNSSLIYSSYLGGANENDAGYGIAADSYGMFYVTGAAGGGNFPVTPGAFLTSWPVGSGACAFGNRCFSAFLTKFNPQVSGASSVIYSTFLGGSPSASGAGVAVDPSGSAYVTGYTGLWYNGDPIITEFPTTPGAFQTSPSPSGTDAFVTKFNAAGNGLIYSTLLGPVGGSGNPGPGGTGIALDSSGNAYVSGYTRSSTFPTTPDAFQPTYPGGGGALGLNAFMTKFNSTGSALVYSSYLGGSTNDDVATSVALDSTGDAYVTGYTASTDFPVTPTPFQPSLRGPLNAFVTKFPIGAQQVLSISGITPAQGGNLGTVRSQLVGGGFHAGAVVKLAGTATIIGTTVEVGSEGQTIDVTFNLSGVIPGNYDVLVTNADGTSTSLGHAFTVTQGGAPQLWVSMTGRQSVHPGRPSQISISFGNAGNVDAYDIVLLIHLPTGVQYSVTGLAPVPDPYPGQDQMGVNTPSEIVIPIWIYRMAAGSSSDLFLGITAPAGIAALPLEADLLGPALNGFALSGDFSATPFNLDVAAQAMAASIVQALGLAGPSNTPTLDPCSTDTCEAQWLSLRNAMFLQIVPLVQDWAQREFVTAVPLELIALAAEKTLEFLGLLTFGTAALIAIAQAGVILFCLWGVAYSIYKIYTKYVNVVGSIDPNEKDGPIGVGGAQYLPGNNPVAYSVFFENDPKATAPAQEVVIADPLDPNLDTDSIWLTQVAVAGQNIALPANTGNALVSGVSTTLDLRPSQSLLLVVTAQFNPASRVLNWIFQSIDPVTGLPPTDPNVGFLAPGAEGSVFFNVTPARGLPTNTQVQNQATVVFDGNAPVATGIWTNAVDNTPPATRIATLPPSESTASFKVQWSGTDQGSGIQDYTIYVSDNGGPFAAFLVNTAATSTLFVGQAGHTYGFYSIARDLVGNVEGPKTSAEASTQATKGNPANLGISPGTLAFGSVLVGSTSVSKTIKLTRTGATLPLLTNISIATSGDYFQTNNCPSALGAGVSCTINVSFAPNVAGTLNGVLNIYDSFTSSPQVVTLTGTGLSPVSVSPAKLSLSSTVGNTSPPSTVNVTNNTGSDVALTYTASATFNAAPGTTNGCGSSLAGNTTCTIAATFTPEQPGSILGSVAFTGAFPPQIVDLTGTATGGTVPTLSFSPAKLTFATPQLVGTTSAPLTVTVTNKVASAITISGITASAGFTAAPSGTTPCSGSLGAHGKCTFQVTFTPSIGGTTDGSVSVGNSGAINPVLYDLVGSGVGPVSFYPASLIFAAQTVGTTSIAKTVTLSNNQAVQLNVASLAASGDYSAVPGGTNPCGSVVSASSTCTFVVTFTPTKIGGIKGAVTLIDDAATSPQLLLLTGKGQ